MSPTPAFRCPRDPRHTARTLRAAALLAAVGFSVWACATNPATGKKELALIDEGQEVALGRDADREISVAMGLYENEALQAYVGELGRRLAAKSERPQLPWSLKVIDDPVVNAFALPGGFIYVTRGILGHLDSEAQLAAVVGHEIGHVTARHGVNQMSKQMAWTLGVGAAAILSGASEGAVQAATAGLQLLFLKYSRDDERQADGLGLRYLLAQGYEPGAMPAIFTVLRRVGERAGAGRVPNWLATHPDPEARRATMEKAIAGLVPEARSGRLERDTYFARLAGTVFGEDPRQGYFREGRFIHPTLRFELRFPSDWQAANERSQVVALAPARNAMLRLRLRNEPSPGEAASAFFAELKSAERLDSRSPALSGLASRWDAFRLVDAQAQRELRGEVIFAVHGERIYELLGVATGEAWNGARERVRDSLGSFRAVSDRKLLEVSPLRVEPVRLKTSMSLAEFARSQPSEVDLDTLALINQVEGGDATLAAGSWAKRVVRRD